MRSRQPVPGDALRRLHEAGIRVVQESAGSGGGEIRCICPDCEDTIGHLYVNKSKGAVYCHRCKKAASLDNLCGGNRLESAPAQERSRILEAAARYYEEAMTPEALDYLCSVRGLPEDLVTRFRVGWAGGGLKDHLVGDRGFSAAECIDSGLIRTTQRGLVDHFRQRLVFPFLHDGEVRNISGRRIGKGPRKWLHLAGRLDLPYNAEALNLHKPVLAEGIIDAMSIEAVGRPSVAVVGTHFKEEWVVMVRDASELTICFDADSAGREGSLKLATLLGGTPRIASLPARKDPSNLVAEGCGDELLKCIDAAQNMIALQIGGIGEDTPRAELASRLDPILGQLASMDRPLAGAYLRGITERFHLSREEEKEYRGAIASRRGTATRTDAGPSTVEGEASFVALFDGLVDIVEHEGQPAFLLLEDGELRVVSSVEREDRTMVPPPAEKLPWLLPRGEEVLRCYSEDTDARLFDDLVAYHRSASELPSEAYYDLLALWDMHTYLLQHFEYSPIITLYAVPERGKSRTGKSMIHVAYRGCHVESFNEAYIVRLTEYCAPSMFFDVMRGWEKLFRRGSEDIILHRFERGARVTKVNHPDRPPFLDIDHYSVFGPTVIATNVPSHPILDTRSLTITMPSSSRAFEDDVKRGAGRVLRERLVAFRARHLEDGLPEAPKPASGRLGDITRPLLRVLRLVRPERESSFRELIAGLRDERLAERRASLEARILTAVWNLDSRVVGGALPVKAITEYLNRGRGESDWVTPQLVGKRLRALGFRKAPRAGAGMRIVYDEQQLKRTMAEYGLKDTARTALSAPDDGSRSGL